MAKTETVHTRVTSDIKEKADKIFNRLGLTTSQAITFFDCISKQQWVTF